MVNHGDRDEIIRFVLDSSPEENENLSLFIAGVKGAYKRKGLQGKNPHPVYTTSVAVPARKLGRKERT